MRTFAVFNAEQIENLPFHYYAKPQQPAIPEAERNEGLDRFFRNTGALIRHGGNRAYFAPSSDHVQMPPFPAFRDPESYYAALAHEMPHWTGHASRKGQEVYAKEELVAELGAAFLSADLAITPETREDHAAYIAHWLKALKDDKRFIFTAAAHAQRAADYLHSYPPQGEQISQLAA